MYEKEKREIPYVFPTDYHMAPFQESYAYQPYVKYIGVMRDAIEKAMEDEEYLY